MTSIRQAVTGAVALAVLALSPSLAAQEAPRISPAGADGLPAAVTHATATKDGGLLLIPVRQNNDAASLLTVRAAGPGRFVVEPANFDTRTFGSPTFEHAAQDIELTTWAVAGEQVMWRGPSSGWSLIRAGDQNKTACLAWQSFGTTCSVLAPIANQRAILLRPTYGEVEGKRVLGSEVVALQQGNDEPLATVELPGVALGPAVTDGEGGFWVMLRRTKQATGSFKPMRGYLHYTSRGVWEMWSDSGEVVDGTTLIGRSEFVINPEPRKMAPDMQGGFFAVGKDEIVYQVKSDGSADAFSTMQPRCEDCHQLAIAFDATRRELHMISAQWKGSGGRRSFVRGLSYMRFDANGGRVFAEDIPLPPGIKGDDLNLFDSIKLFAEAGQVWVLGRQMLLHRSNQGWSWLGESGQVAQMIERERAERAARERAENANPTIATAAFYGAIGVTVGSVLAAVALTPEDEFAEAGQESGAPLFGWSVGTTAGILPGMLLYPSLASGMDDEYNDTFMLIGAVATPLAVTLGTWVTAEAVTADASWRAEGEEFSLQSLGGAAGGAVLGTVISGLTMKLVLDNIGEEVDPVISAFLGSAMTAGLSTVGWALTVPQDAGEDEFTEIDPLRMSAPRPMMGTSLHFTF